MRESILFSYDGIYSVDMGLLNVSISGGMFEETFLPERKIVEVSVNGNDKPYFQDVSLSPLSFDLTFAFEDSYDEKKIREVARWLNQDFYKPFYTLDNQDRIFYCMVEGDSRLIHNGLKQGYITLTMKCDSPYSYTPKYAKDNTVFGSTKITKTIDENTFNNEMGTMTNIEINGNGDLTPNVSKIPWTLYSGMKWSDI